MTPAEVRKQIAAGAPAPLYLLEGDDVQSRHDLALEFASLVDEGLRAFNVESFHAGDVTTGAARDALIASILSTARTLPMMAPRRVILLHDAERILSPRRGRDEDPQAELDLGPKRKRGATPVEELEAYVERPEPMTTLVLVAGPLDGNRRLVKLLRARAVSVDCGSLGSTDDAVRWVRKRLEKDELTIEPKALALLLEATGLALSRLRAEVEKLVLYAAGESAITASHVRDIVIPQDEPGEVFALMDFIRSADAPSALREVAALLDAGTQPPMVLGQIRAAAIRLRPDRVKGSLDAVFRADLAIKSSAGTPRFLLECLVVELCARG